MRPGALIAVSQPRDCAGAERVAEITELTSDLAEQPGGGTSREEKPAAGNTFVIDGISDPLYQAFVATGLHRPR